RRPNVEGTAIRSLSAIAKAQEKFREADIASGGSGVFTSLPRLEAAKVLEPLAGSAAYTFESHASTSEPQYFFWAMARPATTAPYKRVFFINQVGVVYYAATDDAAANLRPDPKTCAPPPGWIPVGK
ncbi:MAG: hypothetical protein ACAI25_01495, partial [Planctomycetota bacterium]